VVCHCFVDVLVRFLQHVHRLLVYVVVQFSLHEV